MTPADERQLDVRTLGLVPYPEALEQQLEIHRAVAAGERPHTLLLLEHPPVYTFGKRGGQQLLLKSESELRRAGATFAETDRGGLVTFHGPGQLVGYPICHLGRLGLSLTDYIERLLSALVATLARFGVTSHVDMERPGIWVGERKIGAVGVRLRDRVTYHGFALNVTTDLNWFEHIVACGLEGVQTTSLARELPEPPAWSELGRVAAEELAQALGFETTTS